MSQSGCDPSLGTAVAALRVSVLGSYGQAGRGTYRAQGKEPQLRQVPPRPPTLSLGWAERVVLIIRLQSLTLETLDTKVNLMKVTVRTSLGVSLTQRIFRICSP